MVAETDGVEHGDHEPFLWRLRAENPGADERMVTVRIFIAPAEAAEDRRAWIEMDKKWDIWNCVNNSEPVLNKVRALSNRGLKQELLDALLELLLADERYGGGGAAEELVVM